MRWLRAFQVVSLLLLQLSRTGWDHCFLATTALLHRHPIPANEPIGAEPKSQRALYYWVRPWIVHGTRGRPGLSWDDLIRRFVNDFVFDDYGCSIGVL